MIETLEKGIFKATPASLMPADIEFRHSCGPLNSDPCADLGGEISVFTVGDGIQNLFETLAPKATRLLGHIDFRCFYIINTHPTDTLRNAKVYMEGTGRITPGTRGGSFVMLGIPIVQEIQTVVVTEDFPGAFPNEGDFMELEVPGYPPSFKVFYDPNITKWEGNFLKEIRAIEGLHEVRVTATGDVPNVTFTINYGGTDERCFLGQSRSRTIDTIMVIDDQLDNASIATFEVQDGSPVNTTAVKIASETIQPPGIIFECPFRGNPKEIGNLRPGDFLPVWVRREIPKGTLLHILDNFTIRVDGTYP